MDDKQAKALGLLVIDQLSGPVHKLYTSLEGARLGLEMNEPDFSIKCVQRAYAALGEMMEASASVEKLARSNGIERRQS